MNPSTSPTDPPGSNPPAPDADPPPSEEPASDLPPAEHPAPHAHPPLSEEPASDLPCREFVQLVSAYLEGTLPEHVEADVEEHLDLCEGCRTVLAQWRTVIALAGRLTEAEVDNTDELTRDRLQSTFRGLRRR